MRAKDALSALQAELDSKQEIIVLLLAQNERLTAAALSENPVAAAHLRPPREHKEKPAPIIPIGM